MTTLLGDSSGLGYGVPAGRPVMTFVDEVAGMEVEWTLGVALSLVDPALLMRKVRQLEQRCMPLELGRSTGLSHQAVRAYADGSTVRAGGAAQRQAPQLRPRSHRRPLGQGDRAARGVLTFTLASGGVWRRTHACAVPGRLSSFRPREAQFFPTGAWHAPAHTARTNQVDVCATWLRACRGVSVLRVVSA